MSEAIARSCSVKNVFTKISQNLHENTCARVSFLKYYCHYWNQCPRICLIAYFRVRIKTPKFGTKNVSFGYLLGLAWFQIRQGSCHIWNHARILLNTNFVQKYRSLNLPEIYQKYLICVFWEAFLKNHCHIWNQSPRICLIHKVWCKTKNPQIWDQECLIWVFLSWNLIISCHIWNQLPRICLSEKSCERIRMPKFGTKNVLLGYFWARIAILLNCYHIWDQRPGIC